MKFLNTKLDGVIIILPEKFNDERGYFQETWNNHLYNIILNRLNDPFIQDNESCSKKGVARGMHWQIPPMDQSKLVRCLHGKIIDIIVDITKNSPTFGEYIFVELSPENNNQVFIPRGYAHGFISLEDDSIVSYKVDNYYSKDHERSFNFTDIDLKALNLPFDKIILSDKDNEAPKFSEIEDNDLFYSLMIKDEKNNDEVNNNEENINGETGSDNG